MWEPALYNTTKLTLELRDIVDNGENSVDIWAFDYPSYYKGEEKKAFEQKVIDHFYFRQIGFETVGRFLHYFRSRVREVMPYYIQMYQSEALMKGIEDPFGNVDITETFRQTSSDTSESTANGSATSETSNNITTSEDNERRFSNTPQGSISNLDSYMSEAEKNGKDTTENATNSGESTSTASSSNSSSGTIEHTFTKKGNQGVNTYAHDMIELRQTFLNIDMLVINELNTLFLGVY